jgi:hypothetical protein
MNAKQLITPNLDPTIVVNGKVLMDWLGWCLAYVVRSYNTPLAGPDAWYAWNVTTKHKHLDRNIPAGVYVPIWFSHFGTYNGITKNWGHVAIYKDGKVWSSPLSRKPYADVFNSIAEVEQKFRAQYQGWSEDVAGTKVIELIKEIRMDTNDGNEAYQTVFHRAPENTSVASQWNGYKPQEALAIMRQSAEWKLLNQKLSSYDSLVAQINDLSTRPSKAELQAAIDKASQEAQKVADLEAQLKAEQDKPPVVQTVIDPSINQKLDWIIAKLKTLQGMLANLFKRK